MAVNECLVVPGSLLVEAWQPLAPVGSSPLPGLNSLMLLVLSSREQEEAHYHGSSPGWDNTAYLHIQNMLRAII